MLRAFLDADAAMRESPHPRVELEIATVRATRRPEPRALEDVLQRVEEAEARLRQQAVAAPPRARVQESLLPSVEPAARPPPPSRGAPPRRPSARPLRRRRSPPPRTAAAPPPSRPAPAPSAAPAPAAPPASEDLATGWQRVVEEVMRTQADARRGAGPDAPAGRSGTASSRIVLTGNHFHREMLADSANRDLIGQALRRHVAGAERFSVIDRGRGQRRRASTDHPAVQAAVAQFQGEVVAVRPRLPEGEGQ